MHAGITIGKLAEATGTKAETIRFYEKIGILAQPGRTTGNYRSYSEDHVRRLTFVRRARDLGFPLETVRILLSLVDQPERSCAAVDEIVIQQRDDVEQRIADLERLRDELDRLSQQCKGGRVSECRIIDALLPAKPQPVATRR